MNFMRDNLVARSSSGHVNFAKYIYTLFEYKTKYQQEGIAKTKSMLFQAIAIFSLYVEKIWKKKLTILSGTKLDGSNFVAEGLFACSLTCEK